MGGSSIKLLSTNQFERMNAIASMAKGSGVFGATKGGSGYMGAFVDKVSGQTHYVKFATKISERWGLASQAKQYNSSIKEFSNTLLSDLAELAEQVGVRDKFEQLFDSRDKKFPNLLSRKFVAQAVSLIANKHNQLADDAKLWDQAGLDNAAEGTRDHFNWKSVVRARSEKDTTFKSVIKDCRLRETQETVNGRFFATAGVDKRDQMEKTEKPLVGEKEEELPLESKGDQGISDFLKQLNGKKVLQNILGNKEYELRIKDLKDLLQTYKDVTDVLSNLEKCQLSNGGQKQGGVKKWESDQLNYKVRLDQLNFEIEDITAALKALDPKDREYRTRSAELSSCLDNLNKSRMALDIGKYKSDIDRLNFEIKGLSGKLLTCVETNEKKRVEKELQSKQESLKESTKKLVDSNKSLLSSIDKNIGKLELEIGTLESEIGTLESEIEVLKSKLNTCKEKEKEQVEKDLQSKQKSLAESSTKLNNLRISLQGLKIDEFKLKIDKQKAEVDKQKSEIDMLNFEIAVLRSKQITCKEEEKAQVEKELQSKQKRWEESSKKLDDSKKSIYDLIDKDVKNLSADIKNLENLIMEDLSRKLVTVTRSEKEQINKELTSRGSDFAGLYKHLDEVKNFYNDFGKELANKVENQVLVNEGEFTDKAKLAKLLEHLNSQYFPDDKFSKAYVENGLIDSGLVNKLKDIKMTMRSRAFEMIRTYKDKDVEIANKLRADKAGLENEKSILEKNIRLAKRDPKKGADIKEVNKLKEELERVEQRLKEMQPPKPA